MKPSHRVAVLLSPVLVVLGAARAARADTVVQFPLDSILDARTVSTLNGATVVPWTVGQGVDGNGYSDGYVTLAVEAKLGQTGVALPNDGVFPASATTGVPEVVLHFSNANASTIYQTHNAHSGVAQTFHFAVPQATYSMIYLFMTTSEGALPLTVTMTYSDATTSTATFTLPDFGTGQPLPTNPPIFFDLISGMHKWNTQDAQVDTTGHTITGVKVTPTTSKDLVDVAIARQASPQYLVFWGATGIATSAVDAGTPAGDAASTEDAAGSGSSSGSSGNSSSSSSSGAGSSSSGSTAGSSSGAGEGDAASVGTTDGAATGDASESASSGGSSGCQCAIFDAPSSSPFAPWGALLAVGGALVRRVRSNRARCDRQRHGRD